MSLAEAEAVELELEQPSGLLREAMGRLRRNPGALAGMALIGAFVVLAVAAPLIAPYGPDERVAGLASNPPGPSAEFWFGLDEQGRDLYSRLIFGARLSLLIGVVAVAVGLSAGMVLGSVAGYFGGKVDAVIMRGMDVLLAFPSFLLAIGLVTILGRGLGQVMIAVGVTNIPIFARLLRGAILAQRESDYVLAARSLGTPGHRILLRHLLPNSVAPVIVQATLAGATAIIDVAGLSFLGLGPAVPGLPEWGLILSQNAGRLAQSVHLVVFPGFAIVLSVLGLNLIGDGLREAIDPKLRK